MTRFFINWHNSQKGKHSPGHTRQWPKPTVTFLTNAFLTFFQDRRICLVLIQTVARKIKASQRKRSATVLQLHVVMSGESARETVAAASVKAAVVYYLTALALFMETGFHVTDSSETDERRRAAWNKKQKSKSKTKKEKERAVRQMRQISRLSADSATWALWRVSLSTYPSPVHPPTPPPHSPIERACEVAALKRVKGSVDKSKNTKERCGGGDYSSHSANRYLSPSLPLRFSFRLVDSVTQSAVFLKGRLASTFRHETRQRKAHLCISSIQFTQLRRLEQDLYFSEHFLNTSFLPFKIISCLFLSWICSAASKSLLSQWGPSYLIILNSNNLFSTEGVCGLRAFGDFMHLYVSLKTNNF